MPDVDFQAHARRVVFGAGWLARLADASGGLGAQRGQVAMGRLRATDLAVSAPRPNLQPPTRAALLQGDFDGGAPEGPR